MIFITQTDARHRWTDCDLLNVPQIPVHSHKYATVAICDHVRMLTAENSDYWRDIPFFSGKFRSYSPERYSLLTSFR